LTDVRGIISELEQQRAAIDQALAALREISGFGPAAGKRSPKVSKRGGKRKLSPEGRARIAEATRRRWAEQRAAKAGAAKQAGAGKTADKRVKRTKAGRKKKAAAKRAAPAPKAAAGQQS
jgi:hypothetical protein